VQASKNLEPEEKPVSLSKVKDAAHASLPVSSTARAVRASAHVRPEPTGSELVGLSALKEWANKMPPSHEQHPEVSHTFGAGQDAQVSGPLQDGRLREAPPLRASKVSLAEGQHSLTF
jgi:hypothetical protein